MDYSIPINGLFLPQLQYPPCCWIIFLKSPPKYVVAFNNKMLVLVLLISSVKLDSHILHKKATSFPVYILRK